MAEFCKVMRQFDRMCKANAGCFNCLLHKPDGVSDECSIGAFVNDSERIEREVMSWAAAHPERVYPERVYPAQSDWHIKTGVLIPADIAQKLGIQPKEG